MKIKRYTLKTMCTVLICTILLSSFLAVNATDAIITETPLNDSIDGESEWIADEESLEEIEVTYEQPSSYNVIIPKTIALDTSKQATYSIKVTGNIDTNECIHVVPVDGISDTESIDFYMKNQAADSRQTDVVATVTQNKFYWNSVEVADGYEETKNSISAPDLTAGTWKGTFQVAINLETMADHIHNYVDGVCTGCGEKDPNAEHEHNYVDGKCDCGAIDPDHTHNYEDGKCTICGEENDPYEVAPVSAINNWNYTLDDTNDVITLNYYKGSETDVIVYARYEIDDKIYKTQLSSNTGNNDINERYMFNNGIYNSKIVTITFNDGIDTSNVTDMSFMFNQCKSLKTIDFGASFDTSNVTNMHCMFHFCESLSNIDLSSFATGNVTNMTSMFRYCESLTNLNLSSFDTSNVVSMNCMFCACNSLRNINLSSFDTSNVTDMASMFIECSALTSLDLRSFDTGNVTDMSNMFCRCTALKTIYVTNGKWSTSKATTSFMFSSCGTSSVTYK